MTTATADGFAVFEGHRLIALAPAAEAALAARQAEDRGGQVLVFGPDGRQVDFDLRGTDEEIRARFSPPASEPRGRGRPRLGVVAREVTLLPRHWDWLGAQPGGASVTLRKLVEEARKADAAPQRARQARDAAYRFMTAMGGDLPNYEDAIRALYAGDRKRLEALTTGWPADIRDYALALAAAS